MLELFLDYRVVEHKYSISLFVMIQALLLSSHRQGYKGKHINSKKGMSEMLCISPLLCQWLIRKRSSGDGDDWISERPIACHSHRERYRTSIASIL